MGPGGRARCASEGGTGDGTCVLQVASKSRDDAAKLVDPTVDPVLTADVRGKELGFVQQIGGDIDEALVNGQHDDFEEQGHPGGRASRQLIEEPKSFVARLCGVRRDGG